MDAGSSSPSYIVPNHSLPSLPSPQEFEQELKKASEDEEPEKSKEEKK
jgi:hypothetical protein